MSYYRYGQEEKKITFADTDKRHAELRLKLRRDGISPEDDDFKVFTIKHIDDVLNHCIVNENQEDIYWASNI